jgi:hypothetical protein
MNNIQKSGIFGTAVVVLIFIGMYSPFASKPILVRPIWMRQPEALFFYLALVLVAGVIFYILFDDKIMKVK